MKDKYINDIEPMIQNWLKSGNENTTMIAYEIAEYVREQVKLCSIPHVIDTVCNCSPTVAIMNENGNCKNCGKTLFKE